ncbi:MAG: twin-arginine translocase TatA/TatE family subunit [Methyloceanibacter sp.]|nr:twin-arginine translocase TatA/TatE family subunit [Methyloceanibacter sp.]
MGPSWWQIAIVVLLFVLLFGRGKISDLMGDVAKGIKSFKSGLADDEKDEADAKAIPHETPVSSAKAQEPEKQKSS